MTLAKCDTMRVTLAGILALPCSVFKAEGGSENVNRGRLGKKSGAC